MIVAANLSGQPDLWSATACRRFVTPYLRERPPVTKRRQPVVLSFR
jgi:hypothetical protein